MLVEPAAHTLLPKKISAEKPFSSPTTERSLPRLLPSRTPLSSSPRSSSRRSSSRCSGTLSRHRSSPRHRKERLYRTPPSSPSALSRTPSFPPPVDRPLAAEPKQLLPHASFLPEHCRRWSSAFLAGT